MELRSNWHGVVISKGLMVRTVFFSSPKRGVSALYSAIVVQAAAEQEEKEKEQFKMTQYKATQCTGEKDPPPPNNWLCLLPIRLLWGGGNASLKKPARKNTSVLMERDQCHSSATPSSEVKKQVQDLWESIASNADQIIKQKIPSKILVRLPPPKKQQFI